MNTSLQIQKKAMTRLITGQAVPDFLVGAVIGVSAAARLATEAVAAE